MSFNQRFEPEGLKISILGTVRGNTKDGGPRAAVCLKGREARSPPMGVYGVKEPSDSMPEVNFLREGRNPGGACSTFPWKKAPGKRGEIPKGKTKESLAAPMQASRHRMTIGKGRAIGRARKSLKPSK